MSQAGLPTGAEAYEINGNKSFYKLGDLIFRKSDNFLVGKLKDGKKMPEKEIKVTAKGGHKTINAEYVTSTESGIPLYKDPKDKKKSPTLYDSAGIPGYKLKPSPAPKVAGSHVPPSGVGTGKGKKSSLLLPLGIAALLGLVLMTMGGGGGDDKKKKRNNPPAATGSVAKASTRTNAVISGRSSAYNAPSLVYRGSLGAASHAAGRTVSTGRVTAIRNGNPLVYQPISEASVAGDLAAARTAVKTGQRSSVQLAAVLGGASAGNKDVRSIP